MNQSKLIARIIIVAGSLWIIALGALFYSGLNSGELDRSAAIMGLIMFAVIPAGVAFIVAAVIHARGAREDRELHQLRLEQEILQRVGTRGEVMLGDVVNELGVPKHQVEQAVYAVVGKNLFTGYVDWKSGRLISVEASQLPSDRCPNCGGEMELAGRGVARCAHCGTDIFLSPSDQAE